MCIYHQASRENDKLKILMATFCQRGQNYTEWEKEIPRATSNRAGWSDFGKWYTVRHNTINGDFGISHSALRALGYPLQPNFNENVKIKFKLIFSVATP